jgi:hypothetical protein
MRIALISDIHANLPALEAVLGHVEGSEGIDATYHLGDLVGYAPWPNEVVALLAERCIPGVAGNYDSTTATDYKHCGCKYEDPRQEELSHLSYDLDAKALLRGDEATARPAPLPPRHPAERRARARADGDPRARHPHPEHPLLDGGPVRTHSARRWRGWRGRRRAT